MRAWSETAPISHPTDHSAVELAGPTQADSTRQVCSWLGSLPGELLMVRQPIAVQLLPFASADGAEALISSAQRYIPTLVTGSDKPSVMNKITITPGLDHG